MKKILLILLVAFSLNAKAQQTDSSLVANIINFSDKIVASDTLSTLSILTVDSLMNVYLSYYNVSLKVDKVMLLIWNEKGERSRMWLKTGRLPELTIDNQEQKIILPIKKQ